MLNNSLSPVPFRALWDMPMLTVLHTPADLPRVNAVVSAPGWQPGPAHAYAAVSEHTAQDWRGDATRGALHPQRHRPRTLAA